MNVSEQDKIKVMLVDDSAVIRGLIARTLEAEKDIRIVSSVSNGEMAVNSVAKNEPDVIVLDIEMPVMDGITALPLILEKKPDVKVLICSTLSSKGADVSLRALELGATACLVKPTSTSEIGGSQSFQQELLRLVQTLGRKERRSVAPLSGADSAGSVGVSSDHVRVQKSSTFSLKDKLTVYNGKPSIIAIGSSTGGPQALFEVMKSFKGIHLPVVVTQHMPKTFTTLLAKHIETNCGIPCFEGEEGMSLQKGHAYIAPGGFHMEITGSPESPVIQLNDGPAESFCKPSVEPMMRSLINLYGQKIMAIMLTGMGSDGLAGFKTLADMGGHIVAQDEETSVVWGMPGAVANAGVCSAVLPLQRIGPYVLERLG